MNRRLRAFWNRLLGQRGERAAARYLRRQGMRVLCRGYRTPLGEIDLVAREGPAVVFVEVKARRQGQPAEAITPEKERRITLTALHFLRRHGLLEQPSRFDVITLVWPDAHRHPMIEHIRSAFDAHGKSGMFR